MLLMLTHHLGRHLKALPGPILQWSRGRLGATAVFHLQTSPKHLLLMVL